jgi:hypothetical protein
MKKLKAIIEKKMEDEEFREAFDEYEKEFHIRALRITTLPSMIRRFPYETDNRSNRQ